ncbi:phosphoribosylglycinamide formyltransferase [Serinibacter arcticus]|uniref:Phosphoribosylglycinamide formyltransferase n=1 Tax=Serinibacter arcticus TaxID=1655435 RepID=A0A2U1ZY90_9MICO|nr:MmcQ/YjbR family DNA-binding protein [Serinibacter arcticus]PWD51956.1 phosphoribosylglycinamide formyltransferase [Serinibacter arcticus]
MVHPRMYDDDDPVLRRLRTVALAFPEATEVEAHGRPTFRTTKVFAYFGGSVRGKATGDRRDHALLLKLPEAERQALSDDPRCFEPAYLGPSGWLGLDLDLEGPDGVTEWSEVAELLDSSYRATAPARLTVVLDDAVSAGSDPVTTARAAHPDNDAT